MKERNIDIKKDRQIDRQIERKKDRKTNQISNITLIFDVKAIVK